MIPKVRKQSEVLTRINSFFCWEREGFSVPFPFLPIIVATFLLISALLEWKKTAYFTTPIPDSDVALYWFLSKFLSKEGPLIKNYPIFFSMYYAYFFFFLSKIGNPVMLAIFLNSFFYLLTLLLFMKLVSTIFGKETGILSGILFMLTKVFLFYAILPIKTMVFIFLTTLFIFLYVRRKYFFCGIIGSIVSNIEGLFIPVFILYLLFLPIYAKESRLKKFLLVMSAFLLFLTPSLFLNYLSTGTFGFTSSSSGIHLYIGNHKKAKGIYTSIPGIRPNAFGHFFDAEKVAEKLSQRKLTPAEVNRFWWKMGIRNIFANPLRFVKLYFKKLLLFFSNWEVPNNFNLDYIRNRLLILNFLPIDFALAFSTGIAGFLYSIKSRRSPWELNLILLFYPFILSLFFITSRYRVIYYLPLLAYSAFLLVELKNVLKENLKIQTFIVSIFLLAYAISTVPIMQSERVSFYRGFKKKEVLTLALRKIITSNYKEKTKRFLIAKIFSKARMEEIARFIREDK